MKFSKFIILLLVLSVVAQADPNGRRHHHRPVRPYHHTYYPHFYNDYYLSYGYHRYYSRPVQVTTSSTTTYPSNLVNVTVENVKEDIEALSRMKARGLISDKDFKQVKKTLLNRIGMTVNPQAQVATTEEILDQIESLYEMKSAKLISAREYKKQKNRLLALI